MMHSTRKVILIAIAAVGLGMLLMAGVLHIAVERYAAHALTKYINTQSDAVRVEGISISLLRQQMRMYDVEIGSSAAGSAMISIPEIVVDVDLSSPGNKGIMISQIQCLDPEVRVPREKGGALSEKVVVAMGLGGSKIDRLRISNGRLIYEKDAGEYYSLMAACDGVCENIAGMVAGDGSATMSVSAALPIARDGQLELSGEMYQDGSHPHITISGDVSRVSLAALGELMPALSVITGGELEASISGTYQNSKLDMKNIVVVKGFAVNAEKKFFGIKSEMINDFAKDRKIDFPFAMQGPLNNLTFDFESSITRIMRHALEGKLNEAYRKHIAKEVGKEFGPRLNKQLREVLY